MGQCTNSNCADDSKLGGVTETPEDPAAIQRDLGKWEKWANRNVMKFNKEKYEMLHLGRNNPLHQCVMGAIVSKGSISFTFHALNKYWVMKSVAENIIVPIHKLHMGQILKSGLAKAGPKLVFYITTFHCDPQSRSP